MRKRYVLLIALAALSIAVAQIPASAASYSGTLSTPIQLGGSGAWYLGSTINWVVTDMENGTWRYWYQLSVPVGAVSHFILETSPNFTLADIVAGSAKGDFQKIYLGTWSSDQGNSNPGIPGPVYGLKFDEAFGLTTTIQFDSYRMPMWGDFYAKDGTAGGLGQNFVFNAGFLAPDPTAGPADGSVNDHILVPDTHTVIPEFSTLALGAMGLLPVFGINRLRSRRK